MKDYSYDERFKSLFAYKTMLAIMLKAFVPEYKDSAVVDIRDKYIQGEGDDDLDSAKIISAGTGVEDGNVKYDIKFDSLIPNQTEDHMRVLINIEGQKKTSSLGYDLATRGIYYACNMISSEYGTIFSSSEYNKLEKVYSIWISMSPPKKAKGSIVRYRIEEENLTNNYRNTKENYDKLEVIIFNLGEIEDSARINYNETIVSRALTKLFTDKDKADEAIKELEDGFGIDIPCIVREEMKTMCNLSEAIFERGEYQNKIDNALRMIADGELSMEKIASYTDLTLEEVKELAAQKSA